MSSDITDLKDSLEDEIKREMGELVEDRHYSDKLREHADGWVPESRQDLADLLVANLSYAEPRNWPSNENPSVWDIIKEAIREDLQAHAQETFDRLKRDFEDLKEDLENEGFEVKFKGRDGGKYTVFKNHGDTDFVEAYQEELKNGFKNEYEAVMWWEKDGPV